MNTSTDVIRQLTWDGPVNASAAIALTLAVYALLAWSLIRERSVLGNSYALLFGCLRAAAIAIAIWMLLAPSKVTIERTTTRQSLVIASDISQSMQTVDDAETADDLRWSLASSTSPQPSAIAAADCAVVAVTIARDEMTRAKQLLAQHRSDRDVLLVVESAVSAMKRARDHLQVIATETRAASSARSLLQLLDDEAFEHLTRAFASLSSTHVASTKWQASLRDACFHLETLARQTRRLSNTVHSQLDGILSVASADELTQLRQRPRIARVASALEHLSIEKLVDEDESAEVRFCAFDSEVAFSPDQVDPSKSLRQLSKSNEATPHRQSTDLATSLEQLRATERGGKLAAIVVYSDALHTTKSKVEQVVDGRKDVPVYMVPIGNPNHIRDVVVQSVMAPSVVMKDDNVVIEADIQAIDCSGETCLVELVQGETTLAHQAIEIDEEVVNRRVRFDTQLTTLGRSPFEIRVAPIEGELTRDNNSEPFEVNVTRGKISVLLADQFPRWEYRYLAQLFRRDGKVESDELLFEPREIATGHRESTKTLPTTVDDWAMYDAVILGDMSTTSFTPPMQASLVEYLRQRGGTLVLIAGSHSMPGAYTNQPIQSMLPVTEVAPEHRQSGIDGFAFQLTEAGERHHALMIGRDQRSTQMAWDFVNRNAPARWLSTFRKPRASARNLIAAVPRGANSSIGNQGDGDEQSFLCWQPVGRGRIVYLSGPESYRLQFLKGDRYHYRLWGQLLRWAIASGLGEGNDFIRLQTDQPRYNEDESVEAIVQLTNPQGHPIESAELTLTATTNEMPPVVANAKPDPQVPGRYLATMTGIPAGEYEVSVQGSAIEQLIADTAATSPVAHFLVRPFVSPELLDTRCDLTMARRIAEATGGQVIPPTAVSEVLALTDLRPIITEQSESHPLWIRWELLALIVGCLGLERIIRKTQGWC